MSSRESRKIQDDLASGAGTATATATAMHCSLCSHSLTEAVCAEAGRAEVDSGRRKRPRPRQLLRLCQQRVHQLQRGVRRVVGTTLHGKRRGGLVVGPRLVILHYGLQQTFSQSDRQDGWRVFREQ